MRRIDRGVTESEAWKFLDVAEFGILSVCENNIPYGIPLNHCVINNNIYFHCAVEGRKIDILKANPKVSYCVVKSAEILPDKFATAYESVIVEGDAIEVFDKDKYDALLGLIKKYSQEFYEEELNI